MDPITLFAMLKVSAEQPHPLEVRTFRDMATCEVAAKERRKDPDAIGGLVLATVLALAALAGGRPASERDHGALAGRSRTRYLINLGHEPRRCYLTGSFRDNVRAFIGTSTGRRRLLVGARRSLRRRVLSACLRSSCTARSYRRHVALHARRGW
jgi:hypothetical protein